MKELAPETRPFVYVRFPVQNKKNTCCHPPQYRFTSVVDSAVNCETTVEKCGLCHEILTPKNIDCT